MLRCALCGRPLDLCEGECQDEITMEDRIEYLKSQEKEKGSREEVAHDVRRDED